MLTIELSFPAGRYHATQWGRHVNEGVSEWPPSPYRLVRGLFDVWKRRLPDLSPDRFYAVARLLASPPHFCLPPSRSSHTRSYLHKNKEDASEKALVFDGFVVVDRAARVYLGWPEVQLESTVRQDLGALLAQLNYLGRSESWIAASFAESAPMHAWNCRPVLGRESIGQAIRVAAVTPQLPGQSSEDWLTSLTYSTADLVKEKRSQPPALTWVDYSLEEDHFALDPSVEYPTQVECVLYAMHTKVKPLVTETVSLAEQVRRNVMGAHLRVRELFDEPDPRAISPRFSGKDSSGKPLTGHQHAFYLPLDRDGDGYLDHVLISLPSGAFDSQEYLALHRIRAVVRANGYPIELIPVGEGTSNAILQSARCFRSASPYVPSRFYKKGRGTWEEWMKAEITRECMVRGLPAPIRTSVAPPPRVRSGRSIEWREFQRSRKDEPPRYGAGFELEFRESVPGPFALGYAAHFGLGLFCPS
ncbi:MAG: type I-U CRISPR-associated protein Cas5/Cas6 [Bryobacteraceae bacterium]|nr:type I-U CRISPR-associated protein Cas5/Cas6 [Bryobacteraceae bacterium]